MLIPKSFSWSVIWIDSPFKVMPGGSSIILLIFCMVEMNSALVLARFRVISYQCTMSQNLVDPL